jgi:helicase
MKIADLPIPPLLQDRYVKQGIVDLYPPQIACVEKGLFSGQNLLIAIPTASGKTLVAEMAMHQHAARGGKSLYIVPLKALASEKYGEFSEKGVRVGIATGDYDRKDEFLGRNDIIVATSEKVDSLLRNSTPWLREISLLVVDEIHLLDSPHRGPTLEMVITKMRYRNPSMQVLALSATIGNPDHLGGWLEAAVVTSAWRPVELRQGIYHRGRIYFPSGERVVPAISKFDDLNLVLDTLAEGGQCLIFLASRRNAESFARKAAAALNLEGEDLTTLARDLRAIAQSEVEQDLASCIASGAAYHHAGLGREARRIVEQGFRSGAIRCIASTPTLAAGLNLPARRVLIRDYQRYQSGEGMVPIPVREYHQMAGRAGRPRLDPYGEAILIARDEGDVERLTEWYINASPEDVQSRCTTTWSLCTHILSLIATGFTRNREELFRFLQRTFYGHQRGDLALMETILSQSLQYLRETEMVVRVGERYSSTEYGHLVSRLYLDPRSAECMVNAFQEGRGFSELAYLHLVCLTPDMPTLYVRRSELPFLDRVIREHGDELWLNVPYFGDEEMENYLRGLKTSLLLRDWANEVGEAMICERYGVGPGDLYNMVESVNWLLHAGSQLSRMFIPPISGTVRDMEIRVKNGIRAELLPLIHLRGIGRVRGRRLFNQGLTTPASLKAAGRDKVVPILGEKVTQQVFAQLEGTEGGFEEQKTQSSLEEFT